MKKTILQEMQEILIKCTGSDYVFRGENECYNKVSSTLYRQYCENNKDNKDNPPISSQYFDILAVEKDIITETKQHFPSNATNITILTDIQHHGGKTALIDFTKNVHIALYFACNGSFDKDGRIILFDKNKAIDKIDIDYKDTSNYSIITPTSKTPRVIFQSSVFIHTKKGCLAKDSYTEICIKSNLKNKFLKHLREYHNIRINTIYNDIQGFISNQANYSTAAIEFYRGLENSNASEFKDAIKNYNKAIKLNPQNENIYNNRGLAYEKNGQLDEAIADFDKAIALNPQLTEAYNNRGLAYADKSQFGKAITDYTQAIALNPDYAVAYNNRGLAYAKNEQLDEAIADFSKVIAINPNDAEAYYNRGNAYAENKQLDKAIADYTQAIAFNPQLAGAYNNRGVVYEAQGKQELADKDFSRTKDLTPK